MQIIKNDYNRRSYFGKLFMLFMCTFTCFAIIFTVLIIKNSIDKEKEKIAVDVYCETKSFANWNDTRISTAESLLASMQTNNDVIRYAITGEYKYLASVYNMINTYDTTLTRLGVNIGFLDEKRQKSIICGGVNSLDFSKIDVPGNIDNTAYILSENTELPVYNNPIPAHIFFKQRMYAGDTEITFFFVLYDNVQFSTFLNENVCDYALIYNKTPIFVKGKDDFSDEAYFEQLGKFSVDSNVAYRQQSDTDGLFSYVCKSTSVVSPKVVITGVLCLLMLLAASFLLSVIIAKYLSYPILKLVKKLQYENGMDKYSDFDDIFNAVDNIILNSETLREKNKLNEKMAVQGVLFDICNGNISEHQIMFYIKEYKLSILKKRHTVAMLCIENKDSLAERFGMECVSYLKKDIIEILQVLFPSLLYFNNNLVTSIIIFEGELDKPQRDSIKNTLERIWKQFEIRTSLQIGNVSDNYSELNDSFVKLLVRKKTADVYDEDKYIFDVGEGYTERVKDVYYTLDMESQMITYLLSGKKELAKKLIDSIVDYNIADKYDESAAAQLQACFFVTISRALNSLGKTRQDVYGNKDISEFDEKSYRENADYLWLLFEPIFNILPNDEKATPMRGKIEGFIIEHLKDDVSLDDLATYLNYSAGYASKLFKTIFGCNFKAYVSQCRVETAKKLLRNGHKVSEVAKEVGCIHTETFIRIFKKLTGISPGEYIKQFEASEE